MMNATQRGKPDAGSLHVRFDEGEVASAKPRRGSLLYNRLEFIKSAAAFAGATAAGCASAPKTSFKAPIGDFRALFVSLGHNMWCDWYPEDFDLSMVKEGIPAKKLELKEEYWRGFFDHMRTKKMNMAVIDIGEGVIYPSHPELAIEGSWTPEKLSDEVERLAGMGIEAVPKLNFSTTHNGWLKYYRRMVSTPQYYQLVEDLIGDISEIFHRPRYIHLGCDEEDTVWHLTKSKTRNYVMARRGEIWWYDFLHAVRQVEKTGARPMVWSDQGWDHDDYYERCPKSVVQCNWYYDESYGGFDPATNKTSDYNRLIAFEKLEKAGFDQLPCGTDWVGWKRKELGVGADDVMGKLVKYCRQTVSKEHLMGFFMAPWHGPLDSEKSLRNHMRSIDLLDEALGTDPRDGAFYRGLSAADAMGAH